MLQRKTKISEGINQKNGKISALPIPALDFLDPGADPIISSGEVEEAAAVSPLTWRAIWRQLEQSIVHTFLEGEAPKNLLSDDPEWFEIPPGLPWPRLRLPRPQ